MGFVNVGSLSTNVLTATVVIPMAGTGQRFVDRGFSLPKPLIDINGKPMIQHAIESLGISGDYIFIKRSYGDSQLDDRLDSVLRSTVKGTYSRYCRIITVDEVTEGAACTCLLAEEFIDNDRPLIIANCDQVMKWNPSHFGDYLTERCNGDLDGVVVTYPSTTEKNSYIKIDSDGYGMEVAEKRVISNHSLNGIHFWRCGSDFVSSAKKMIETNERTNGEFYIAPTYNTLIRDGKKIGIYEISEKNHHAVGTPEDLDAYLSFLESRPEPGCSVNWFRDEFDYECRRVGGTDPEMMRISMINMLTTLQRDIAGVFLEDLEAGRAFAGIRKQGDKDWTDLMGHARFMFEKITGIGAFKGVELGTGSGQGFSTIALSLVGNGCAFTCDTRTKNMDQPRDLLAKYAGRGFVHLHVFHTYSTSPSFVGEVMKDGVAVDVLFVDSDHTRKNVIEELLTWLPHLSERAIIFFHDTLWCHDMVKVLVDEVVDQFRTYKFCRDFDIAKYTLENMNIADYANAKAGIDPLTMRPTIQDNCPHAQADSPDYAKDIRINPSDYFSCDGEYDDKKYDLKYEMLLAWPGMISLQKSPSFSWEAVYNTLHKIRSNDLELTKRKFHDENL